VGTSTQPGARAGSSASVSTKGGSDPNSRSQTPPGLGAKADNKIKISQPEIDFGDGQKPKMVAMNFMDKKDIKPGTVMGTGKPGQTVDTLYSLFLNHLLRPREWSAQFDGNGYFAFRREHIIALAEECQKVLEEQPMVLRVDAPIKVFGDIHGQYQDLMRFFDLWNCPSENGDIESFDYLFLGDYVDRGSHSLETICLLMALKVKYPEKIHLLRGNHEDKWINNAFGFAEECSHRLGEDPAEPDSVFNKINELFDWLPLAALIEDKIVCLHGGIGSTLVSIE
jgi:protein phosphatase